MRHRSAQCDRSQRAVGWTMQAGVTMRKKDSRESQTCWRELASDVAVVLVTVPLMSRSS